MHTIDYAIYPTITHLGAIDFLTDIPKAMFGLVMIMILFLPLFLIPYIFIKMGSVAGKVQASLNNAGRGLRKGATKAAMKEGKGMAGRAWQNKSAEWAGRSDGSMKSKVGGYKAQRDWRRTQSKQQAESLQNKAIAERVLSDSQYSAGAAGPGRVSVIEAQARAMQERHHQENVKAARDSLVAQGAQSDRGVLKGVVRSTSDQYEAEAAADLLLKTGGTEEFRSLITDSAVGAKHAEALVRAGRENYGTIDAKSRDVADFIGQQDAQETIAMGNVTTTDRTGATVTVNLAQSAIETKTVTGTMGLKAGGLMTLEPDALKRAFEQAGYMAKTGIPELQHRSVDASLTPAERAAAKAAADKMVTQLNQFMQQASEATKNPQFAATAKPGAQQHLKDIAAGKFL